MELTAWEASSNYRENSCVTQLMSAPTLANGWHVGNHMMDSPEWQSGIGSVVAFTPDADLMPKDVVDAWKFALLVDPGDYNSQAEFVAMFTPENFAHVVQHGQLPGAVQSSGEEDDSGDV